MTPVTVLKAIQQFLEVQVCDKIQLLKAQDNDISKYQLVNPAAHIGWIPPKEYLPEGMESSIPCLIIAAEEGQDNESEAGIDIRISFAIFAPGKYVDGKMTPNFEGYIDLLNFITLVQTTLTKETFINKQTSIEKPIKWGMYKDQPYPYWYGWLTFRTSCASINYLFET